MFETLRSRIAAALNEVAISIDHVGSTAVPGLAAKPIIDIDTLLRSSADLPVVIRRLADLGYEHQGDLGISGREAFRAKSGDFHHHLYVCPPGSREYERHIAFRDYLRLHHSDANAYALLKRELAADLLMTGRRTTKQKARSYSGFFNAHENHRHIVGETSPSH